MSLPRYGIFSATGVTFPPPPLSQFGPRMKWTLSTRSGSTIAEFYNRKSSRVDIERNGRKTATLAVSIYDEFAEKIVALETLLKCYYGDRCIYAGPVVVPEFDFDGGTVTITSFDTYFLERSFWSGNANGTMGTSPLNYNTDHSNILYDLITVVAAPTAAEIASGTPGHGIVVPTPPAAGITRVVTYEPGQQVFTAITDLTEILDAPDFSLDAVDRTDGVWAEFNIHVPEIGADKTDTVIFEFGTGRNNCTGFKWGPSGEVVRNRQHVVGQATGEALAPTGFAQDVPSQRKRGIIENWEGSFGSEDAPTVQDRADELLRAYARPPDFFTVQPAIEGLEESYGVPPRVFEDYGIGDDVTVVAKRGNLLVEVEGEITAISLEEATTAGDVRVTLTCIPTVPVGGAV